VLDDHAVDLLTATDSEIDLLVAEQNRQVDVARRFGEKGSRTSILHRERD
jgi:hypothetical protein